MRPTTTDLSVSPLLAGLRVRIIDGETMPQPYRRLLVHEQDMTSTLERFHGERLSLRVLARQLAPSRMERRVLLVGDRSRQPRELGAITIHLEPFDDEPRRLILACRRPLGAILAEHGIRYRSHPAAFLELESDPEMLAALDVPTAPHRLYGRRNLLRTPAGALMAEVLEILPPLDEAESPATRAPE